MQWQCSAKKIIYFLEIVSFRYFTNRNVFHSFLVAANFDTLNSVVTSLVFHFHANGIVASK